MEFTLGEHTYRADRIPAKQQFHMSLHLAPLIAAVVGSGAVTAKGTDSEHAARVSGAIFDALGNLPEDKADAIMFGLLRHAKRKVPGGLGWAEVAVGNELNHTDITVVDMFAIAKQVFTANMSDFMPALRRILPAGLLKQSAE